MRARNRRRALPALHVRPIAVFFAVLAGPAVASAEPAPVPDPPSAPAVVVFPPQCQATTIPLAPFLDSLRVELAGRHLACCALAAPGSTSPSTARVHLVVEMDPCTEDSDHVRLSAQSLPTARETERQLSLVDVASSTRPRALALAAAELIQSLGPEPEPAAVAAAQLPVHPSSPVAKSAPDEPRSSPPLALTLALEGRDLPAENTRMWGARLSLTTVGRRLYWDLDLGASYATANVDLGTLRLRSTSVGLGVGPRFSTRHAALDLGVRAELGWAWVSGDTGLPDVHTGALSGPVGTVGLRAAIDLPAQLVIRPRFAVECGEVVRGLVGAVDGRPTLGLTGFYVLAALGMAVSL